MQETISIVVTGRVQGVFYRKSAKEKALSLGLTGEVKNQPDGSVAIIASGVPETLEQFVDWCKQGPPRAIVDRVSVIREDFKKFNSFEIVR